MTLSLIGQETTQEHVRTGLMLLDDVVAVQTIHLLGNHPVRTSRAIGTRQSRSLPRNRRISLAFGDSD